MLNFFPFLTAKGVVELFFMNPGGNLQLMKRNQIVQVDKSKKCFLLHNMNENEPTRVHSQMV